MAGDIYSYIYEINYIGEGCLDFLFSTPSVGHKIILLNVLAYNFFVNFLQSSLKIFSFYLITISWKLEAKFVQSGLKKIKNIS